MVYTQASTRAIPRYVPGGSVEDAARRSGGGRVVKLASNESPYGPSPLAARAAREACQRLGRYPAEDAHRLRDALARRHHLDPLEVQVTNGSTEAIQLLVDAVAEAQPDAEALVPAHTFIAYERACRVRGLAVRHAEMEGWDISLSALASAITPRTRLIFLATPNNPTGRRLTGTALSAFLDRVPPEVLVVLDEAYHEYAAHLDPLDGLALRARHPNVVVLRTFSKCYALASLRVGWLVGPADLVDLLDRVRVPFNTNGIGQAAALAALEDDAHLAWVVRRTLAARESLTEGLRDLGFDPVESAANFVLVPVGPRAAALSDALLDRGVIVRSASASGLPHALRVTVGLDEEHEVFLSHLEALSDLHAERALPEVTL